MNPNNERNRGSEFTVEQDTQEAKLQRQAKQFIPDEAEAMQLPEAISGGETLEHLPAYQNLRLDKLPWKGMRIFLSLSLGLLGALGAWQVYTVYQAAQALHWLLAAGFLSIVIALCASAFYALWHFLTDRKLAAKPDQLRLKASRINEGVDQGAARDFIQALDEHYQGKPQYVFFKRAIENLPDYSNDQEILQHIDRVFLQPLDQEAARRVSAFSLQTAVGVSISPWALMDMMLALWRMVKMADEVAQVYGIRPSLAGRLSLLKQIGLQLVYVGATEVAMEQYFDELSQDALGGVFAARGLQGLGAGVYSIRVGICAMKLCRPIAFSKMNEPRFSKMLGTMLSELKRIVKKKV